MQLKPLVQSESHDTSNVLFKTKNKQKALWPCPVGQMLTFLLLLHVVVGHSG